MRGVNISLLHWIAVDMCGEPTTPSCSSQIVLQGEEKNVCFFSH